MWVVLALIIYWSLILIITNRMFNTGIRNHDSPKIIGKRIGIITFLYFGTTLYIFGLLCGVDPLFASIAILISILGGISEYFRESVLAQRRYEKLAAEEANKNADDKSV